MLRISYSLIDQAEVQKPLPNRYLEQLPPDYRARVFQLRKPIDRYNRLSGAILLKKAAMKSGFSDRFLYEIESGELGRPFHQGAVDFNISHSNYCTVCAISTEGNIGVDIEHYRSVDINDFKTVFNPLEWFELNLAKDQLLEFFNLWTAKEAVAKADGRGLYFPFDQICLRNNVAIMDKQYHNISRFSIDDEYIGALASSSKPEKLVIERIHLWS